jgi:hypothetical protein
MAWENWRGDLLINLVNQAAINGVKKTGEVILEEAKKEVPLDEGILQHTGIVIMASGNIPACVVSFGGGNGTGFPIVPYAIRWHEEQANFQHGRKRFYLRDPFNRLVQSTLQTALMQEMGVVLR